MPSSHVGAGDTPALLTAEEVARLLRLSVVTVRQRARQDPERFGRVKLGGREVRLRAEAIRKLLAGEG